jgi:hypothetical protein
MSLLREASTVLTSVQTHHEHRHTTVDGKRDQEVPAAAERAQAIAE